ncbi:MAG TPA: hypothetical protein VEM15_09655 [Thermodesulfobacteriota bacterium]|nr:hypothetical protein [Thermodesulfobacteriota bacterium]
MTKLGHFKQKTQVNLKEVLPGEVDVKYKWAVSIVGKLAMFGDRIMRSRAKQVKKEFTKNLQEKSRGVVQIKSSHPMNLPAVFFSSGGSSNAV